MKKTDINNIARCTLLVYIYEFPVASERWVAGLEAAFLQGCGAGRIDEIFPFTITYMEQKSGASFETEVGTSACLKVLYKGRKRQNNNYIY